MIRASGSATDLEAARHDHVALGHKVFVHLEACLKWRMDDPGKDEVGLEGSMVHGMPSFMVHGTPRQAGTEGAETMTPMYMGIRRAGNPKLEE